MLISDNLPVRKSYFDSNIIARILRRFFLRIILKRTSTEAHVYIRRHQGTKFEHFHISNVIYHKFSLGAVSYTLNGENVKVMLELVFLIKVIQMKNHCTFLIEKLENCILFGMFSMLKFSAKFLFQLMLKWDPVTKFFIKLQHLKMTI